MLQLDIGLQGQDGVDFGLLSELLDVNLEKRVGTQDNVLEFAALVQWMEEEAFQESAVGFLDNSIDYVDVILNLPVAGCRGLLIADLSLVNVRIPEIQCPLRLSFDYFFLGRPLDFLDV